MASAFRIPYSYFFSMDNKESSGIELAFVPDWARKSPEKWTSSETNPKHDAESKRGRQGKARDVYQHSDRRQSYLDRNRSAPAARADGQAARGARFGRRSRNNAGDFESGRKTFRPAFTDKTDGSRSPQTVLPKIAVSFIPERSGLKPLVKQLSRTRRAYSLFEVATTFLSKPEFYAVAIEATGSDGQPALPFYQCGECKAVFANKQLAFNHGLNRHINLFYDQEEKDCEPPQGKFLCVARCTLSGELLGPPNYHEFNDKLLELHRTRFADLPIDQYRKKIINETDPASIEKWKKEVSRKKVYRTKLLNEPVAFERSSLLEQHFTENYAPALIREGYRFVVPATVSHDLDDHQIKQLIQESWKKEMRFPINMASAILKRFHQLGLHIFKTSKMTFVSAVKPRPIDPAQATNIVRNILEWIRTNSGKTRQDLVVALVPGTAPESTAVTEIIDALVWLIDRGHVIEFMNGTLAVPNRAHSGKKESKETSVPAGASGPSGNDPRCAPTRSPEPDSKQAPSRT